uniref:Uncharacterized protein n=1 Tax=Oryza sativa subsp. japonica TaxID=39947 RepID=Q6K4Z5_ORYSJ|nr:hypothetical protein [Oryza sativa Japonica Group]BAD19809.1 hypothetical protein [Oryza sativa Japonica Group]
MAEKNQKKSTNKGRRTKPSTRRRRRNATRGRDKPTRGQDAHACRMKATSPARRSTAATRVAR